MHIQQNKLNLLLIYHIYKLLGILSSDLEIHY